MKESVFVDDFNTETTQMLIDNLNLLYVALTRAEKSMFLICNNKEVSDKDDRLRNVSQQIGGAYC